MLCRLMLRRWMRWRPMPGRLMDRRANPLISSAAAEIARHGRVDILVGGILVVLKKCDRLHDLARLAVTALRHPDLHPRLLHRMHGRYAFNGRDLGATDVAHGSDAGAYRRAILMHGACAAQRHAAAELRPRKLRHVAQIPKQRHFGIAVKSLLLPVHFELDHSSSDEPRMLEN